MRAHWPDRRELQRRLPGRTADAIRSRADTLGLEKARRPPWTARELALLLRLAAEGGTPSTMLAHFPGRTRWQLAAQLKYCRGLKRLERRPPAASGLALMDAIRAEAHRQNVSFTDLDRLCGCGRQFVNGQKTQLKYLAKAVEVLGGELSISWSDASS